MADGPGVDVLEGGRQAEQDPNEQAAMRQAWRAEAERAAEYFSAIPGFANMAHEPERADTLVVSIPEAATAGEATTEGETVTKETVTKAKEEKLPRRKVLSRLRHPLGGHPHAHQESDPSVAPAPDAEAPAGEPQPEVATVKKPPATKFHSSF